MGERRGDHSLSLSGASFSVDLTVGGEGGSDMQKQHEEELADRVWGVLSDLRALRYLCPP